MLMSAFIASMGAHAHNHDWESSEPRWRVMHEGLHSDELRVERAAYDLDASLLLSRRCVGFALPPGALRFFGDATQATVHWRVDGRKVRAGVFVLSPTRSGVDLCAADTFIKDWEKRFAKDVLGIDNGTFMAEPPKALTVRLHGPAPSAPGGDVEGSFGLDGVRDMACRYGASPRKQLRACGGN